MAKIPGAGIAVNYELQYIRCGKRRCRCMQTGNQASWHGPYWYAFWNDPTTGKKKNAYIGKNFTPPTHERADVAGETMSGSMHEAPWNERRRRRDEQRRAQQAKRQERERERQRERAQEEKRRRHAPPPPRQRTQDERDADLLGVSATVGERELKRAWREKIVEHHPDRYQGARAAEQEETAKEINQAYQRMRKRRGWR